MPINSVPVDQQVFTRLMLVAIEPKTDRETGTQITSNDGTQRKWTVQVVASMPSRFDATRTESEVLQVTLTSADDPTGKVSEGDQVFFSDLTAGVMPPEQSESGRIRGGKLFWSCSGVHSRQVANAKRGGGE